MNLLKFVRWSLQPQSTICPLIFRFTSTSQQIIPVKDSKDESKAVKEEEKKPLPHVKRIKFLKQKYASNPPALMEFFDNIENWTKSKVRVGREWRVEELRIKSNSDLHKLWYILLKERNMLLTMAHEAQVNCEAFPNPERRDKVEQSMINIEAVVKERNKAYMELEVGEGETYERPAVFREDLFGRHGYVDCKQHLIPYFMNKQYQKMYGPGKGKYVSEFIALFREQKANRIKRRTMEDWAHVRQLLRRFPNMDLQYLQELYPRVPVKYFKDHLDRFKEVEFISNHATQVIGKEDGVDG